MSVPTWTDAKDRVWSLAITIGDLKLVRELSGIDLLSVLDGDLTEQLEEDPIRLAAVFWVLSKRQATESEIVRDEFESGIDGDAIERACDSLFQSLTHWFFPELSTRKKSKEKETDDPDNKGKTLADRAWKNIHEMAGVACVEPSPLSWRELAWMATGRRRLEWRQTSGLLTLLANVNRDPKKQKRPFSPDDFMPDDLKDGIRRASGFRLTSNTLYALKPYFAKANE